MGSSTNTAHPEQDIFKMSESLIAKLERLVLELEILQKEINEKLLRT